MLRYKTQTRPGLVALYNIWPGNGAGLFLQPQSPNGAIQLLPRLLSFSSVLFVHGARRRRCVKEISSISTIRHHLGLVIDVSISIISSQAVLFCACWYADTRPRSPSTVHSHVCLGRPCLLFQFFGRLETQNNNAHKWSWMESAL